MFNNQTTTLAAKLAAIEAAVKAGFADEVKALGLVKDAIKAMDGTLKNKLDALKEAINDQTTELSTKLEAIEAAVEEGFISEVEALGFIEDAIEAMDGNLQAKLNAVVAAVRAQTLTLETKLALIETALNDGFATEEQALGLIQTAVETMDGNLQTKLNAVVAAIRSQTASLETKLELIEAAINNGFTTEEQALGLIQEAIEHLPEYTDVLGEIRDAITSQTTDLSTKLNAIVAAVRTGFANEAQALGLIQAAIEAIEIPNYEGVLGEIKDALTGINNKLSLNGAVGSALSGIDQTLATIAQLIEAQDYTQAFATLAQALANIQSSLDTINTTLDERLAQIKKILKDGFENVDAAIAALTQGLADILPEDFDAVLNSIGTSLSQISWNLSNDGPLAYQLAALNAAIAGENGTNALLADLVEAFLGNPDDPDDNGGIQGLLEELVDAIAGSVDPETGDPIPGIADALADIAEALQEIADALNPENEPNGPENPSGYVEEEDGTETPYVQLDDDLQVAVENVGAESVTDPGDMFAWGEVATKDDYTLENYSLYESNRAAAGRYIRYNEEDGLTTLTISDDAVAQNMSDKWRMMTADEWNEFLDPAKFELTWTEDYNNTGAAGTIVTSLIGDYAGNYIFLPDGAYYSSTLGSNDVANAITVKTDPDAGGLSSDNASRYVGRFARGVVGAAPEDPEVPEEPFTPENPYEDEDGNVYIPMAEGLDIAVANVGAENPYDFGNRYAWGEIETKGQNDYTLLNYKWFEAANISRTRATSNVEGRYIKYNEEDNHTVLTIEDDAAAKLLGEGWRMMTVAEFKKLTNNEMFEVEYIRDYNGSGKAGVTVTSLVEGYEGNYIFLPEGHYWTSELAGSIELATQVTTPLAVESGQFEFEDVGRYFGNVVRGIRGTAPADFDPIDLPASPEYPSGYDENGNAYVEMGNGLRWATENVGAESFAASGEFFAWGETVTKESFTWDTYFDTQDGGASFLKYARNKLTVLAPEDDAASVKMGGTWRIPTIAEWNSFLNEENATCTETNNYENSGVGGYIVTSKVEGYVGNSIFFPAPGYMIGDELNGAGSTAAYWASDLSTTNDQTAFSKVLSFPSSNYQRPRNAGYSVRGVMPVPSDDASGRR